MSAQQQVAAIARPVFAKGPRLLRWHRHLRGLELVWAIAFVVPYAAVFLGFVVYPIAYGLWLGRDPALYEQLFTDPRFQTVVVNTLVYVGLAVNVKMFLALLLSGFFMRRRWWVRALLVIYILPWTLPAVPGYLSFHWMLIGEQGLVNVILTDWLGVAGPIWFGSRWLAVGCNIVVYIWKWMPLWTLIFLAGRMAIPQDLYEAADVDGASAYRRFRYVTLPLLANLYFISTLISTIWTIADFNTVFFVSGGAPIMQSDVLSTLALHYSTDFFKPQLAVACGIAALPLMIPLVVLLMRRLRSEEVQL